MKCRLARRKVETGDWILGIERQEQDGAVRCSALAFWSTQRKRKRSSRVK